MKPFDVQTADVLYVYITLYNSNAKMILFLIKIFFPGFQAAFFRIFVSLLYALCNKYLSKDANECK